MAVIVYRKWNIALTAVFCLVVFWMFFSPQPKFPDGPNSRVERTVAPRVKKEMAEKNKPNELVNEDRKIFDSANNPNWPTDPGPFQARKNVEGHRTTIEKNNKQEKNKLNELVPEVLRLDNATENDVPSNECRFNGTFQDNLNKLSSLEFPEIYQQMRDLGFNQDPPYTTTSLPVFVTGISSSYYSTVQGLLKSVHENLMPTYPDLKFIVFDIGLTEVQVRRLRKYCRCDVRPFPFYKFPSHVRTLRTYAFKPIIASLLFHEFGRFWWLDASARFITKSLAKPLLYLRTNGQLFYTYSKILNVAIHTHPDTFGYFREDPCPFEEFGEIEAGNVAFVDTPSTRTILRNWVSCALIAKCISPDGAQLWCPDPNKHIIGGCHRFDQSVLSIMLRRLYHKQNNYPDWDEHYRVIEIKRGQGVKYFPEM